MSILISDGVLTKIGAEDHGSLSRRDVEEAFANNSAGYCYEQHKEHFTPNGEPSLWFVAYTNHGVRLKVMFVREREDVHVKSAYPATDRVTAIFEKHAKPVEGFEP